MLSVLIFEAIAFGLGGGVIGWLLAANHYDCGCWEFDYHPDPDPVPVLSDGTVVEVDFRSRKVA